MGNKRRPKKKNQEPEKKTLKQSLEVPIDFSKSGAKEPDEKSEPVNKPRKKSVREVIESQYDPVEEERKRRKLLASSWQERNNIFRSIFGKPSYVTPEDYGPPSTEVPDDFIERMESQGKGANSDTANPGDPTLDEQHLAVLAYGPDPTRPYWTYVTAGLASPWLQTEWQEVSGFGCELVVKSPEDNPWAPTLLRTLAFYVFNHAGLLSPGVRLGLNAPINQKDESLLRNIFMWYADEVPNDLYQLPSGAFGIFAAIGITDKELEYADSVEDYGTWCLQEILRHVGHHQVTNPERKCFTEESNIEPALATMKAKADSFRQFAPTENVEDDF